MAVLRRWQTMTVHKNDVQVDDNMRDKDGHWITIGPRDIKNDPFFGRSIRGSAFPYFLEIRRLVVCDA